MQKMRVEFIFLGFLLLFLFACLPFSNYPTTPKLDPATRKQTIIIKTGTVPDSRHEENKTYAIAFDTSTRTLYKGTDEGAYKSKDGGKTWSLMKVDFSHSVHPSKDYICEFAISPSSPNIIYAAAGGAGVLRSKDSGETWTYIGPPSKTYSTSLAIDPKNPNILFAGGGSLFLTKDGGETWIKVIIPNTTVIYDLILDPTASSTLYIGAHGIKNESYLVLKSINGGNNWVKKWERWANALAIDPITPRILYAGGNGSVFKSTDGGETWREVYSNAGLVFNIVVDPTTPTTIYVGGRHGLLKSVDSGNTWTDIGNLGEVYSLAIIPGTKSIIYVGTEDGLVVI
jgi:photosystem II stability/assembly factor-like uncharacterized protein